MCLAGFFQLSQHLGWKHLHKMKYYPVSIDLMNKEKKKSHTNTQPTIRNKLTKKKIQFVSVSKLANGFVFNLVPCSISVEILLRIFFLNAIDSGNDMAFSSKCDHLYVSRLFKTLLACVQISIQKRTNTTQWISFCVIWFMIYSIVYLVGFGKRMKIKQHLAIQSEQYMTNRHFLTVWFFFISSRNVNLPSNSYKFVANFSAYYAAVTIVTTAAATDTTSVAATFNNSSIPFVQFRFDIAIHFYNTFEQKTLNRMPNRVQYTEKFRYNKKRPNKLKT